MLFYCGFRDVWWFALMFFERFFSFMKACCCMIRFRCFVSSLGFWLFLFEPLLGVCTLGVVICSRLCAFKFRSMDSDVTLRTAALGTEETCKTKGIRNSKRTFSIRSSQPWGDWKFAREEAKAPNNSRRPPDRLEHGHGDEQQIHRLKGCTKKTKIHQNIKTRNPSVGLVPLTSWQPTTTKHHRFWDSRLSELATDRSQSRSAAGWSTCDFENLVPAGSFWKSRTLPWSFLQFCCLLHPKGAFQIQSAQSAKPQLPFLSRASKPPCPVLQKFSSLWSTT